MELMRECVRGWRANPTIYSYKPSAQSYEEIAKGINLIRSTILELWRF